MVSGREQRTDVEPLRESLAEGKCLGVFPAAYQFGQTKRFFWVAGYPVGELLVDLLDDLVEAGVLMKNDDEQQYKWDPEGARRSQEKSCDTNP